MSSLQNDLQEALTLLRSLLRGGGMLEASMVEPSDVVLRHTIEDVINLLRRNVTTEDQMTERGNTACNPHPDAPHGFNRNASHNARRYVCDCEGWMPTAGRVGD